MFIRKFRGRVFFFFGGLCVGFFLNIDCESDIIREGILIWCWVKENGKEFL